MEPHTACERVSWFSFMQGPNSCIAVAGSDGGVFILSVYPYTAGLHNVVHSSAPNTVHVLVSLFSLEQVGFGLSDVIQTCRNNRITHDRTARHVCLLICTST